MTIKRIAGIGYLLIGVVWSVLNLPNLISKTNGNSYLAATLGVGRIVAWPVFVALYFMNKNSDVGDEATDVSSDD